MRGGGGGINMYFTILCLITVNGPIKQRGLIQREVHDCTVQLYIYSSKQGFHSITT